jgi:hypothetical protein
VETSASFEARSAPRSYPTVPVAAVHESGSGTDQLFAAARHDACN